VVHVPEVNFGEKHTLSQTVNKILDMGKRISVLDRHAIELPVVNAHPEGAILLLYEEDRRTAGSLGGANGVIRQVFIEKRLQLLLFRFGKGVNRSDTRRAPVLKVNSVVERSRFGKFDGTVLIENIQEVVVLLRYHLAKVLRAVRFFVIVGDGRSEARRGRRFSGVIMYGGLGTL
jgi:hypothetical protein